MRKTLRDAQRTGAKVAHVPVRFGSDADALSDVAAPRMNRTFEKSALAIIATILTGMVLLSAKALLVPIIAALMVGSLIGPLMDKTRKHGVPASLVSIALTLLLGAICYFVVVSLAGPVAEWIARAPEVGKLLQGKLGWIERLIAAWREVEQSLRTLGGSTGTEVKVATTFEGVMTTVLATVTPAVGQILIFAGALLFFLAGRKELKQKLTLSFGERDKRLKVLKVISDIESSLTTYLTTATLINLGMGVVAAVITAGFGLANPIMWGVAAFALNYLPYVGPTVMTVLLLLAGLISFDGFLLSASLPAAYVLAATIESHFITPSVMGQRLHLNAFVVFLALAFWTWLWGLAGAFLAVPLLIAAQALFHRLYEEDEIVTLPE